MNTLVMQTLQHNVSDTKRVHKQSLNTRDEKLISKHKTIFICNL